MSVSWAESVGHLLTDETHWSHVNVMNKQLGLSDIFLNIKETYKLTYPVIQILSVNNLSWYGER